MALGLVLALLLGAVIYSVSPGLRRELESRVITTDGIGIWQTDPVYGYRHIPGSHGRHTKAGSFDVAYTIDDSGNRVTPVPGTETGRVLVLGCSYTFGHGVEDDQSWPWRLGEARPGIRVVNRAVMGWGTVHALISLEDELLNNPPDLVLYGWIPGHLRRNYIRHSWVSTLASFDRLHPHYELGDTQLEHRGVIDLSRALPDSTPGLNATEELLTLAMLKRMHELCEEAGIPIVLLRLGNSKRNQHVVDRLLKDSGVRVLDLTGLAGGRLRGDGHPNPRWHTNVARELTPLLDETQSQ